MIVDVYLEVLRNLDNTSTGSLPKRVRGRLFKALEDARRSARGVLDGHKSKNAAAVREAFPKAFADVISLKLEHAFYLDRARRDHWQPESFIEFFGYFIPPRSREFLLGDLFEDVHERRLEGRSDSWLTLYTLYHLILVIFQMVPSALRTALLALVLSSLHPVEWTRIAHGMFEGFRRAWRLIDELI